MQSLKNDMNEIADAQDKVWREAARGNVESHLGDVVADYESEELAADAIYDEVYVLAFDGAKDAGATMDRAREIALEIATSYAQP
jgi:hypothetical protein